MPASFPRSQSSVHWRAWKTRTWCSLCFRSQCRWFWRIRRWRIAQKAKVGGLSFCLNYVSWNFETIFNRKYYQILNIVSFLRLSKILSQLLVLHPSQVIMTARVVVTKWAKCFNLDTFSDWLPSGLWQLSWFHPEQWRKGFLSKNMPFRTQKS